MPKERKDFIYITHKPDVPGEPGDEKKGKPGRPPVSHSPIRVASGRYDRVFDRKDEPHEILRDEFERLPQNVRGHFEVSDKPVVVPDQPKTRNTVGARSGGQAEPPKEK